MVKLRGAAISILVFLAIAGCSSTTVEPLPTISILDVTPAVTPTLSSASGETPATNISSGMVEKLGIEDLAIRAQCILVGTVKGSQSYWNSEKTAIYTDVAVSVEGEIKGCSDQREIVVRVPGGIVGDIAMQASAAPTFGNGERVLLFLEGDDGVFRVLGGFQGKLIIQDETVLGAGVSLSDLVKEMEQILNRSGL